MEKYGNTETTEEKSEEMGQTKEGVFASLPRSGLLEPEFSLTFPESVNPMSFLFKNYV